MGYLISSLIMFAVLIIWSLICVWISKNFRDPKTTTSEDNFFLDSFGLLIILSPLFVFWYAGGGLEILFPKEEGDGGFTISIVFFPFIVTDGLENLLLNGFDINGYDIYSPP